MPAGTPGAGAQHPRAKSRGGPRARGRALRAQPGGYRKERDRARRLAGRSARARCPARASMCVCSCCPRAAARVNVVVAAARASGHAHRVAHVVLLESAGLDGRRIRARATGVRCADLRHARRPLHRPRCAGVGTPSAAESCSILAHRRAGAARPNVAGFSQLSSGCSPGKVSRRCSQQARLRPEHGRSRAPDRLPAGATAAARDGTHHRVRR